jgi:hypothetical protein
MFTHLISMIAQVMDLPAGSLSPSSSNERRTVLVDLVSRLCGAAARPADIENFRRLAEKYRKCKECLRSSRAQTQALLDEVERNREMLEVRLTGIAATEESKLLHQVRDLEGLLKELSEKQTAFLHREEAKVRSAPRRPLRKPIPIEEVEDEIAAPVRQPRSVAVQKPRKRLVDQEEVEISQACRERLRDRVNLRRSRVAAEYEADEVLQRRGDGRKGGVLDHDHVNELIRLTNRLQKDYKMLRGRTGMAGRRT